MDGLDEYICPDVEIRRTFDIAGKFLPDLTTSHIRRQQFLYSREKVKLEMNSIFPGAYTLNFGII
jgi:hypothetical protein